MLLMVQNASLSSFLIIYLGNKMKVLKITLFSSYLLSISPLQDLPYWAIDIQDQEQVLKE